MRRTTVEKSGANAARTPYDELRRARHELRHRDQSGLMLLLDDYFAHADELEVVGPRKRDRRAA